MYLERRTHSLTKVSIAPFPDVPGLVHAASCVLLICIHVLNNPIRFVDPTGHCGRDSNDSLTEDCEELKQLIEENFGISVTGEWTFDEIHLLDEALQKILDVFTQEGLSDPHQAFRDVWEGLEIKRDNSWGCGRGCTTSKNKMTLYDGAFLKSPSDLTSRLENEVYGTIVHELTHVWDRREGYDLAEGLKDEVNGRGEFCIGSLCVGTYKTDYDLTFTSQDKNSREYLAYAFQVYVTDPDKLNGLDKVNTFLSNMIQNIGD